MNDHNLDDLIIDNIDPKNSKTKSFLTIIALAIVVLIVAIILTKIILKDPSEKVVLEEDNTELISPELTLQSVTKVTPTKEDLTLHTEKKVKPAPIVIKKTTIVEPKKTAAVKPNKVAITNEFSQEAKRAAEKKALANKIAQEKKAAQIKKEKALEIKRLAEAKAKKEAQAKKALEMKKVATTTSGYFIQVGSFTQTPSTRFLSVIKNSGFNYKITPASSSGTKKLLIGPYTSRADVDTALVRVRDRINKSAFVVKK